ncbi:hypothetical protein [Pseudoalteromonas gelatinilytica]|uniref:Uncharacterized protein n=1 Tax=Pseudoalteromonas gelatinilytica TaxID=1703256 RepID=A0ABQ1TE60_9GAMM|nr:hypothetical protein [Pseudoalteromonas profundi]GGE93104.1 hypothetical protein GCM10008027_17430 [Pseudoalteromonas profundi]
MQSAIEQLNSRLQHHQLKELIADYQSVSGVLQAAQLQHIYQLACSSEVKYLFLQNVAAHLLEASPLPSEAVALIDDIDKLSFFTPGLKFQNAFCITDNQGNTLLHHLFTQCQTDKLPFNYLRSLMLFESNESLGVALKTLNKQQLSPIGCFIALNSTTQMLAKHEFSALLAMMEVDQSHSPSAVSALVNTLKQFYGTNQPTNADSKVLLCAAYLQVPTAQLLNSLNQ